MRRVSLVATALVAACTFGDLDGLTNGSAPAADAGTAEAGASAKPGDAGTHPSSSEAGTACTAITDGLLGHWTLDAASVQGRRIVDSSPAKNDGVIVGGTLTTTAGHFGDALAYPGDGTHIEVQSLGLDTSDNGITSVSLWAMRSGNDIDDVLLSLPWQDPRYDLWWTNEVGNSVCFNTDQDECWGISDTGLHGRWVHFVAIFHNGPETASELYVDGTKRTLSCVPGTGRDCNNSGTAALPLAFGGTGTDFPYRGSLDDIRAYDRALTDAEVTSLFSGSVCP